MCLEQELQRTSREKCGHAWGAVENEKSGWRSRYSARPQPVVQLCGSKLEFWQAAWGSVDSCAFGRWNLVIQAVQSCWHGFTTSYLPVSLGMHVASCAADGDGWAWKSDCWCVTLVDLESLGVGEHVWCKAVPGGPCRLPDPLGEPGERFRPQLQSVKSSSCQEPAASLLLAVTEGCTHHVNASWSADIFPPGTPSYQSRVLSPIPNIQKWQLKLVKFMAGLRNTKSEIQCIPGLNNLLIWAFNTPMGLYFSFPLWWWFNFWR